MFWTINYSFFEGILFLSLGWWLGQYMKTYWIHRPITRLHDHPRLKIDIYGIYTIQYLSRTHPFRFPMASERDRSNALDSSSIVPVWLAMPFCLLGPTAPTRPPCTRGWRKKEGCGEGVLAADMASSQRRWKSLWLLGSGSCSGLITMFESQQVSQMFADLKSAVIVLRC